MLISACKHEITNPDLVAEGNCHPDTAYFRNDVFKLIIGNCATVGCHDAETAEEGVVLDSYSKIKKYVTKGMPRRSELYKVLFESGEERMPPPPMNAFTDAQKALIFDWIDQGALDNECTGGCDSTIFTFSGAVQPVINSGCVGCHNQNNAQGKVRLDTYDEIKKQASNGALLGSLSGDGYAIMPPAPGAPLSDCEINTIAKWIKNGSAND